MTDEQKFQHLLKVLKGYAEQKHCYNKNPNYHPDDTYNSHDDAFEDGCEFGEILLARTLLEQIGVEYENPVMKENDFT